MKHSTQHVHRSALLALLLVVGFAFVCSDLALATDLPVYGGPGGNEFRAECPKGSYLVGLTGRTGAWVNRIAPICAPWLRGSQTLGAPSIGQSFGMSGGGQEHQAICTRSGDNRLAIQSWWIHLLRSDNHYVQFIQVYCDSLPTPLPPTNWGPRLDFGTKPNDSEEMITYGPFGSQPPFQACPAGEAAVGIHVRAGRFVDAIGLVCGPIPARVGAPTTKLPSPLVQAPSPAQPFNPQAKNMQIPADMFVIVKPGPGDKIVHGQLVITATPPRVGATNVTELELRYLDAPPTHRDSYPYVTVFSVDTAKLLQGYPVAQIVTGGYGGRWQVRARASMKAVPGPWSLPVQFQLSLPTPAQSSATQMFRPLPTMPSQGSGAFSGMIRPRGVEEKEAAGTASQEKKP